MLLLNIIISILLLLNNPLKQEFIRIGPSYLITAFVDRGMVRLYSFHDPSSSRSIPYRVVCCRERKLGNNWKVEGSKSSLSHPMSLECNHKHRYQNDACTLIAFGYLHYGLYIHTNITFNPKDLCSFLLLLLFFISNKTRKNSVRLIFRTWFLKNSEKFSDCVSEKYKARESMKLLVDESDGSLSDLVVVATCDEVKRLIKILTRCPVHSRYKMCYMIQ